jgi:hypothetical protein
MRTFEEWRYMTTRWREVNITPRPLYPRGNNSVQTEQEAGLTPRGGLDVFEKRKTSCPHRNSNPGPFSPELSHYTDYTPLEFFGRDFIRHFNFSFDQPSRTVFATSFQTAFLAVGVLMQEA